MMKVEQLNDNSIRIDNRTIKFPLRILQLLEQEDAILILLNNYGVAISDPNRGRNIIAYSRDGRKLWRVEDARYMVETNSGSKVSQGYTGLQQKEDGTIYVWVMDWRYLLDPETGKISDAAYMR